MPELPEVETTIKLLKPKVLNRTFVDIWTDSSNLIKKPSNFLEFKKDLRGKKILDIKRAGKNIIFELSDNLIMLVHQKMTGHLLYGQWKEEKSKWVSLINGPLKSDSQNRFLHIIFFLENGYQIALSDLRKFAKIETHQNIAPKDIPSIGDLGPDALKITQKQFATRLKSKKGKIKQVLMNQNFVAGIGNIYSDEILFEAKIHPLALSNKLTSNQINRAHKAMRNILKTAVKMGGTSFSDYRAPNGQKGGFGDVVRVYRKTGQKCPRCQKAKIARLKIGSRSSHFCPHCQK